ncbi:MAG: biotin/lipoyl-binding protein [Alphaproteobacteria bacterium]|nr:biotin/lipoyl-binding protein [Alphaproteobacteria bacterium]
MFSTLLIANRGEIAVRVIRTARRMGIETVAVYSDADAGAMHVAMADRALRIGPAPAQESYLKIKAILDAAAESGAQAIHPGYGFLSENTVFAEACAQAGIVFVGPPPAAISAMGLKDRAKALMAQAGVAVVPGYLGDDQSPETLAREAGKIGYPVLIKAVAGGGGKGMRRVDSAGDFAAALESARREAQSAFGDAKVLIEKYVTQPRHIEVQVFADTHGNAVHLFERDCSLQRRHQKVIEEAPAPGMSAEMRAAMGAAAVKAAKAVNYAGAGTVEFIADASDGLRADRFWFMEMNTRLQVEHPVTEGITGLDLVEWQLRVAAGEKLPKTQGELAPNGHAIEARLYAEDPQKGFLPAIGTLEHLNFAGEGVRVDTGVRAGDAVSPFYDPMIAKVIAHGNTRDEAAAKLAHALAHTEIAGLNTNAAFLVRALHDADFLAGRIDTGFIPRKLDTLVPPSREPLPRDLAAAAKFLVSSRRQDVCGGDPWSARDGFRLQGEARETVEFSHAGKRLAVQVVYGRDGERFVVGDEVVAPSAAAVARLANADIALMQGGETMVLSLYDPFTASEAAGSATDSVSAPMPGKVVQIFVKAGDHVTRGQPLAVLEAMKMEHTLSAAADAKIESVEATAGDQVGEGTIIVRFEKAKAA